MGCDCQLIIKENDDDDDDDGDTRSFIMGDWGSVRTAVYFFHSLESGAWNFCKTKVEIRDSYYGTFCINL